MENYNDMPISELMYELEATGASYGFSARNSLGDENVRIRGETEEEDLEYTDSDIVIEDNPLRRAADKAGIDTIDLN